MPPASRISVRVIHDIFPGSTTARTADDTEPVKAKRTSKRMRSPARFVPDHVADRDVVARRAPLVERRRAVRRHRPGRRDGDRLPDGEFHVVGRVDGSPSLRWSQLTVRSTLSFTATRLCSMISRMGLSSSV